MPGIRLPFLCALCKKRTTPKNRRKLNDKLRRQIQSVFKVSCQQNDVICNKCRFRHLVCYKSSVKEKQFSSEQGSSKDPDYFPPSQRKSVITSPPSVHLKIATTPKSHARCFICKRPGPKLVVVSAEARFTAYINSNVIVRSGSRCCPVHIQEGQIKPEALETVETADTAFLNRSAILELMTKLRKACLNNNRRLDFNTFSNEEYINMTGISKPAFDNICQSLEGHIRNTPVRDLKTTVGIFFFKLRSGLSDKLLSTLFGITKSSIRRAVATVRQSLMIHFVPQNLGVDHMSKEELITNHTRPLATSLFTENSGDTDRLILVLYGTYRYIQKSQNYLFQRRSYSLHKGRPLAKPMVVVTTTGYYLTVVGPYLADSKNSDAKILNHILLQNVENIKSYVQAGDIFIVDRGFRDSLELLQDFGIQAKMPSFMAKGDSQMTTDNANTSRLVTKIWWVVESANARIMRWKYLDQTLPTNQVPNIGDYVKIVRAVSNKYLEPLSSPLHEQEDKSLGERMLKLSRQSNSLKSEVEKFNLNKKKIWKNIVESVKTTYENLLVEYTNLKQVQVTSRNI